MASSRRSHPFLVVAPTSVVGNWANEAARFVPDAKVAVVSASTAKSGKSIAEMVAGAHLVVTSYALFRIDEAGYTEYGQLLQERSGQAATEETASVPPAGWGALVLDEAQFVKNAATRAWKARGHFQPTLSWRSPAPHGEQPHGALGDPGDCG